MANSIFRGDDTCSLDPLFWGTKEGDPIIL
jgi:hypothetical protein